ncbi:hypothetical protein J1605_013007 [Eschrichtius robustus]|uniref:Uncharacterized protein n=1 Tax=Eschrichtius robustus TaxID=9764 RepID=A0AB34GGB1_ESCRO|nr:hypothetical protein J1605_013007 [Eschrichtius robustus]
MRPLPRVIRKRGGVGHQGTGEELTSPLGASSEERSGLRGTIAQGRVSDLRTLVLTRLPPPPFMDINPGWGRTAGPLLEVNSPEDQLSLRFRPTEPGQHQRRHCQGRKATEELPLAGLCAQVDLCPRLDGKDLPPEQGGAQLPQEIPLARLKPAARSRVRCEADRPPTIPRFTRPGLPLLQPGLGCRRHPNQRPFARSPEEALVWTFEREHCGSRLGLKTRVRGSRARAPPATPQPRGLPGLLPQARSLPLSPFPREHQGRGKPHGVEGDHSALEVAVWEAEGLSLHHRELLTPHALTGDGHTHPHGQPPGVQLYCPACRATCGSRKAFENHCSPLEHTQMLALDMAVPWKHRSLPAGLSMLGLCPRPNLCEFGDVCTKAHSEQALQEWTQRAGTVALREHTAWREGLLPYQARPLAEYQQSRSEVLLAAEGVSVHFNQPLAHQAQEKQTQHAWTFTEAPLLHVALLKQAPGADFSLAAPSLPPGRQWVVFHFCPRPVLLRKLELQLGQAHPWGLWGTPAPGLPEELERWHAGNCHVGPGVERTAKYKRLHQRLHEEEVALQQLVAELNLRAGIPADGAGDASPGHPLPATGSAAPVETRAGSEQAPWLLPPTHYCASLGLQPETRQILEVQFQMDLLAFPPWHQAMDALPEEQLVLPNPLACALPSARSTRPARQQQAEAASGGHHGDQPRGHAAHRPAASC